MPVINLPGGQDAFFRDPEQVPERLRRPVSRALMRAVQGVDSNEVDPLTGEVREKSSEEIGKDMIANGGMDLLDEANDHLVLALVTKWSLDAPLTLDGLLDLPGETYDALREAASPHLWALMPKNFAASKDEQSPTVPSGD